MPVQAPACLPLDIAQVSLQALHTFAQQLQQQAHRGLVASCIHASNILHDQAGVKTCHVTIVWLQ